MNKVCSMMELVKGYTESGEGHFEGFYKIGFTVFFVWMKLRTVSYASGRVLPRMRRR